MLVRVYQSQVVRKCSQISIDFFVKNIIRIFLIYYYNIIFSYIIKKVIINIFINIVSYEMKMNSYEVDRYVRKNGR